MRGGEVAVVGGKVTGEQVVAYSKANEANSGDGAQGSEPGVHSVTFISQASEEDVRIDRENRQEEEEILLQARKILAKHRLSMKIIDVEFLLNKKKLFFYFTAEQRVDFRAYVRDLAREFRTRIELRQIGVRDEAKVARGIAPCGRPCCCSYWLHNFLPIGIKMVKEQNLALNPTKISGICGRLMCCMSYEHKNYRELWKKLPSPGNKIRSDQGLFILMGVDVYGEDALVRAPGGAHVSVPVGKFAQFKEAVLNNRDWQEYIRSPENEVELDPVDFSSISQKESPPQRSAREKTRVGQRNKDQRGSEKTVQPLSSGSEESSISHNRRRSKKKRIIDQSVSGGYPSREGRTSSKPKPPQAKRTDGASQETSRSSSRRRRKKKTGVRPSGNDRSERPKGGIQS
ncbi:MAG: hypothetical protein CSA35_07730 [Dethiosulfovibrio peptidovorans]|nr:MAG: hypothetical protein CSA35_07730 [Dethiosulfovibrio peptidovorans]